MNQELIKTPVKVGNLNLTGGSGDNWEFVFQEGKWHSTCHLSGKSLHLFFSNFQSGLIEDVGKVVFRIKRSGNSSCHDESVKLIYPHDRFSWDFIDYVGYQSTWDNDEAVYIFEGHFSKERVNQSDFGIAISVAGDAGSDVNIESIEMTAFPIEEVQLRILSEEFEENSEGGVIVDGGSESDVIYEAELVGPSCLVIGSSDDFMNIEVESDGHALLSGESEATSEFFSEVDLEDSLYGSGDAVVGIEPQIGGGIGIGGVAEWVVVMVPELETGDFTASGSYILQQTYASSEVSGGVSGFGSALNIVKKPNMSGEVRGVGRSLNSSNSLQTAPVQEQLLRPRSSHQEVPSYIPNSYRTPPVASWCDFGDSCDSGYLPHVTKSSLGEYLPPKNGGDHAIYAT